MGVDQQVVLFPAVVAGDVELDHPFKGELGQEIEGIKAVIAGVHVHVVHVQHQRGAALLQHLVEEGRLAHLGPPEGRVVGDVLQGQRHVEPGLGLAHALDHVPHGLPREGEREQLVEHGARDAAPAQVLAVGLGPRAPQEAPQLVEIAVIQGVGAAEGHRQAVGQHLEALADAGEGLGEIPAATHVILGRDLDEGEARVRVFEQLFQERPPEAQADAVHAHFFAGAAEQVPAPQDPAPPPPFFATGFFPSFFASPGFSSTLVASEAFTSAGFASEAFASAGFASAGLAPQDPSPFGLAPQEPSAAGLAPQEPSAAGLAPQDPSPLGLAPQEPCAFPASGPATSLAWTGLFGSGVAAHPTRAEVPRAAMAERIEAVFSRFMVGSWMLGRGASAGNRVVARPLYYGAPCRLVSPCFDATLPAHHPRPMATYKRPDHFTKAAKARGFPARSVFKLEEIDRRVRLLRAGQKVLDLGCAPGSWSLYTCERIGPTGRLLAVDLQPIAQLLPSNATFIQGDALALAETTLAAHAPYQVVLSDMAPNTTGNRNADQARSYHLYSFALSMAARLGDQGSSFVGKIFMGPDFELAREQTRELFAQVRLIRPEGVRPNSFEIFLVGLEKRTPPLAPLPSPTAPDIP